MFSLKEKYTKEVIPVMKEKFGYKNDLAVPKITKVIVNTGFNPNTKDEKIRQEMAHDLALITGQKANPCPAKKAEAAFKTRKGMIIGLMVTLRGQRMYDFLDRLVHIILPRSRDFHGLPEKNIDQSGNLNIGLKEQIVFPEISAESTKNIFGFEVAVVTTAKNHQQGVELFKLLGFPIKHG
ncbi:MAG: 50S ribosomal protein L5 [Candidatus Portnoybacteria bacterium]|nr:50S ribosomal protein L5 [Candidatus Portnoybacteria bacterium]